MKNHRELVEAVQVLNGHCNTLETFGRETFGFIQWKSMPQRVGGEAYLELNGFIVDHRYAPKMPMSSVRVKTSEARKLKTFDRWSPYSIQE
jgi:hypothetical protein